MDEQNSNFGFFETSPEVRSFIYQQLVDLEPYLSASTQVNVITKNPLGLVVHLESEGIDIPKSKLKKMHRVAIIITDEGAKLEAEGLHEDLIEAVIVAKKKLLSQLGEIQDSVQTQQERVAEINHALAAANIH